MKKLLILFCAVIVLFAGITVLSQLSDESQRTVSSAPAQEKAPKEIVKSFVIKPHNGNIAVFEDGADEPFRITSTSLDSLPEADQKHIAKGITAANLEEINDILEDYCS